MHRPLHGPQSTLKYEAEVQENGEVVLQVPYAPGTHVVIFVVPRPQAPLSELTSAAESSLGFWDNPFDEEDWNDA